MAKRVVIWSPTARAELRAIDREAAWQILQAIDRYLDTGAGDVIKLHPPRTANSLTNAPDHVRRIGILALRCKGKRVVTNVSVQIQSLRIL